VPPPNSGAGATGSGGGHGGGGALDILSLLALAGGTLASRRSARLAPEARSQPACSSRCAASSQVRCARR